MAETNGLHEKLDGRKLGSACVRASMKRLLTLNSETGLLPIAPPV